MRYNKYKAYLLILSLFGSTALFAQEGLKQNEKIQPAQNKAYFEDKERGWFWGEKKAEPKKKIVAPQEEQKVKNIVILNGKEYKTIDEKTNVPWSILDLLHPDEIVKLETETKNVSVMYPTEENVLEYKRLQRFISEKALAFTDTNYFVGKQNAEMANWISSTSMDSRLKLTANRMDLKEKQIDAINKHKSDMIILVATLPTCSFCKQQMPLLERFEKEYGVEFKEVDISKNQEFAINYQVEKTPDLFLLYREKNNEPLMTRFGNGLHTIQDLKDGVLASLYTFKKVPKDILEY